MEKRSNAQITTVPGSSINHLMRRKGRVMSTRNRTFSIGVEAVEERRKERIAIAEKKGFEGDEQCGVAERMNVTVG